MRASCISRLLFILAPLFLVLFLIYHNIKLATIQKGDASTGKVKLPGDIHKHAISYERVILNNARILNTSLQNVNSLQNGISNKISKNSKEVYSEVKLKNDGIKDNKLTQADKIHCDSECQRFKQFMNTWYDNPDNRDKPKSVIYFLASGRKVMSDSIESLDKYFNNQFNYPVIIFHEKDFNNFKEKLKKESKSNLFFQEIEFKLPAFLNEENVVENIPCRSKISYRHMCRFQTKLVYEQPIMDELEFYWRLDDDSLLLRPIKYDVFKFMKDNGYLYGYVWKHVDSSDCTMGLWEATSRYINERKVNTTFFKHWPAPRLFYNNFEISAFSIWRTPECKRYIDFIDKLGGIYYFRWGDAPIKGLALSLFVEEKRLHYFRDVGYKHNWFELNGGKQGRHR